MFSQTVSIDWVWGFLERYSTSQSVARYCAWPLLPFRSTSPGQCFQPSLARPLSQQVSDWDWGLSPSVTTKRSPSLNASFFSHFLVPSPSLTTSTVFVPFFSFPPRSLPFSLLISLVQLSIAKELLVCSNDTSRLSALPLRGIESPDSSRSVRARRSRRPVGTTS